MPLIKTAAAACTLTVTKTGYQAGTHPQTSGGAAGDLDRISTNGDVVIETFGTVQHEVTHIVTPPGNKHPKWIEETLADFFRLKAGYTDIREKSGSITHHYCDGYKTGGTGLAALWSECKKTLPSPPAGPTSCGVDMWKSY